MWTTSQTNGFRVFNRVNFFYRRAIKIRSKIDDSGSKVNYTNWAPGEPSKKASRQTWAVIFQEFAHLTFLSIEIFNFGYNLKSTWKTEKQNWDGMIWHGIGLMLIFFVKLVNNYQVKVFDFLYIRSPHWSKIWIQFGMLIEIRHFHRVWWKRP